MLDDALSTSNSTNNFTDDLPRPPKGRRSSTRPAGPPSDAPMMTEAANAPVESAGTEPPKRVTRSHARTTATRARRASITEIPVAETLSQIDGDETAAPQASESIPQETMLRTHLSDSSKVTETEQVAQESADEAAPVVESDVSAGEAPKRTTRRVSSGRLRRRTPATPVETDSVVEEAADAPAAETDEGLAAALSAVELAARTRPRRASRKAAQDLIGGQMPTNADGEVDTQQVLASLVAAIAAGDDANEQIEEDATGQTGESETDDEEPTEAAGESDGEESSTPRRRRRRGGRRRRRSGSAEGTDTEAGEPVTETETESESPAADGETVTSGSSTRRRRRRRRSGSGSSDDEQGEAVKIREPRQFSDEIAGIEGSTRLEAKKQRRRDSRAAGRHRAPVLTEAEFLSRRESVERTMLVRQREDYTQLAVLEDGVLVEHYVDRATSTSLIGSIYLGRVQNVLPSMEAVFIDIGRGRNAVLYAGEVDWDQFNISSDARKVEQVFKSGQTVLVQVSKDPVGAKGARLTGHLSIPGRYVVYSPGGHLSGISRKLPDQERRRLKGILEEVVAPESSVIVRTAAEGVTQEELVADVERLKAQWQAIEKKSKQGSAPQLLYSEPDLTLRIIRDTFTEDFSKLVISGLGGRNDVWKRISDYVGSVASGLSERLEHWESSDGDPFVKFRIEEQIHKGLERKVFLPSGGSLVIDRTEAMTVIDVNTGKFTGAGGNLEETITRNNLEAAEEIVRQLRLRDLGGIIVVDFIDMVLPSNRELLLRRLVECLGRDRTRHQVSEVTSLGLVQMTRKRIGTGLAEAFTDSCDHCGGRGYVRHDDPVESQAPADGGERNGKSHANRSRRKPNGGANASSEEKQANQVKPLSEEAKQATAKLAAAAARHHIEIETGAQGAETVDGTHQGGGQTVLVAESATVDQ